MSTNLHTDSVWKDEFIQAAARLFFVSAYADHVESLDEADDRCEQYPRPGGGDDWFDYAPKTTPIAAYVLAGEMLASFEWFNKASIHVLAQWAAKADNNWHDVSVDADEFGRSLAWMYMGAGVSWFDNHEEFKLEVPHCEVSGMTFDPSAYAPEER